MQACRGLDRSACCLANCHCWVVLLLPVRGPALLLRLIRCIIQAYTAEVLLVVAAGASFRLLCSKISGATALENIPECSDTMRSYGRHVQREQAGAIMLTCAMHTKIQYIVQVPGRALFGPSDLVVASQTSFQLRDRWQCGQTMHRAGSVDCEAVGR